MFENAYEPEPEYLGSNFCSAIHWLCAPEHVSQLLWGLTSPIYTAICLMASNKYPLHKALK